MKRNFVVVGEDRRNLELVKLLEQDGHKARSVNKLEEYSDGEIVIGSTSSRESNFIDYFKEDELLILNAIPTAEGAIQIAMEELSTTIHDSKIMILGYGRLGKVLSKLVNNMGAITYVAARNTRDLAWIENSKYNPIKFKDINKHLTNMDVIFNTVPDLILTKDKLRNISKDTLIIDLASKPGGVDFEVAENLGLNTIHALGIPGKYAPVTAAKIIRKTLYNIIEERGI